MQAVTEEMREPEPVTAADDFKIDYSAAARDALNRVQQELVTKEIEQKVKLELEIEKIQEKLNAFETSEVEETKAPSSLSIKLNVISGHTFGMVPQGIRKQSIAVIAIFRIRKTNSLSDSKLVCLVRNSNSQSLVILGRIFSVTQNGLCASVLLNTLDTTVSIQLGKKLGYALPMKTDH